MEKREEMTEVNFYDEVDDSLLEFTVIISKSNGKCRMVAKGLQTVRS